MSVPKRIFVLALKIWLALLLPIAAPGQDFTVEDESDSGASTAAERYRELTDPDRLIEKKKALREKTKPPFEFFRTQVAPFDVLPYIKANHWSTLGLELQANLDDYNGVLQSSPVNLLNMPHQVIFSRDARLVQEQQSKLNLHVLLPQVPKEILLELTHAGAIRSEGATQAPMMELPTHQMLIPILSPDAPDYTFLNRLQATVPASGEKDPNSIDKQRYYRLVTTQNPDDPPPLSSHPLTWTTISHILWDGLNPAALNVGQQQALLDWLHWGGQLIIVGGPGPSLAPLQDSFLGPFLPAVPSGRNATLTEEDLAPLAQAHRPPIWPGEWQELIEGSPELYGYRGPVPRYRSPAPIHLATGKTIYLTGLSPAPGATPLPLGDPGGHLLGVEERVGRGRILMLALKPTEAALTNWPGLDTMVRRIILRRPEEHWHEDHYVMLPAPSLSWVRYLGRDLGPPSLRREEDETAIPGEVLPSTESLGAWLDGATFPTDARTALMTASGITIPDSGFVLKVMLAYITLLVPVNWLVCRVILRRRELAWIVAPILALGFAVVVERGAAYDMGFESACDEIDLLELQGVYPRAHLSRFAALYSTGRTRYTIGFPNDPTALALPMNLGSADFYLRGEETLQSVFQSSPEPALMDFPVQPRSLSMFRAEQMVNLPGGVGLIEENGRPVKVANVSGLELRDAVVVETRTGRRASLGTIGPEATVEIGPFQEPPSDEATEETSSDTETAEPPRRIGPEWLDAEPFLDRLCRYDWRRPEDHFEYRLVAWTPDVQPGEALEPAVDRHRGIRLVVAHLSYGPTPDPLGPLYDALKGEAKDLPPEFLQLLEEKGLIRPNDDVSPDG